MARLPITITIAASNLTAFRDILRNIKMIEREQARNQRLMQQSLRMTTNTLRQAMRVQSRSTQTTNRLHTSTKRLGRSFYNASTGVNIFSSAMQGALLGSSILRGQLTGLLMNLAFLRFSILGVNLAVAALVTVIGGGIGAVTKFGAEVEALAWRLKRMVGQTQNVGVWLRAMQNWASLTGYNVNDLADALDSLQRSGLATEEMFKGVLGAARAFGQTPEDIAKIVQNAIGFDKPNMDALRELGIHVSDAFVEGLTRQQAATKVAQLLLERYGQATAEYANTATGAWARIKESIRGALQIFAEPIWNDVVVPLINMIADFARQLFILAQALWQNEQVVRFWQGTIAYAKYILQEYRYEIMIIGNVIKAVVVGAFLIFLGAIRLAAHALEWLLQLVRGLGGFLRWLATIIKPVSYLLGNLFPKEGASNLNAFITSLKEFGLNLWQSFVRDLQWLRGQINRFFTENPIGIAIANAIKFVGDLGKALWKGLKGKFDEWWLKHGQKFFSEHPWVLIPVSVAGLVLAGVFLKIIAAAVGKLFSLLVAGGKAIITGLTTAITWLLVSALVGIGAVFVAAFAAELLVAEFGTPEMKRAWDNFKKKAIKWVEANPIKATIALLVIGSVLRLAPSALTSLLKTAAAVRLLAWVRAEAGILGKAIQAAFKGALHSMLATAAAPFIRAGEIAKWLLGGSATQSLGSVILGKLGSALTIASSRALVTFAAALKTLFASAVAGAGALLVGALAADLLVTEFGTPEMQTAWEDFKGRAKEWMLAHPLQTTVGVVITGFIVRKIAWKFAGTAAGQLLGRLVAWLVGGGLVGLAKSAGAAALGAAPAVALGLAAVVTFTIVGFDFLMGIGDREENEREMRGIFASLVPDTKEHGLGMALRQFWHDINVEFARIIREGKSDIWRTFKTTLPGMFISGDWTGIFDWVEKNIGKKIVDVLDNPFKASVLGGTGLIWDRLFGLIFEDWEKKKEIIFGPGLLGVGKQIIEYVTNIDWKKVGEVIVTTWGAVWTFLKKAWNYDLTPIRDWCIEQGKKIISWVINLPETISTVATNIFTKVLEFLQEAWDTHGGNIISWARNIGLEIIKAILSPITEGLAGIASLGDLPIARWAQEKWDRLTDWWKNYPQGPQGEGPVDRAERGQGTPTTERGYQGTDPGRVAPPPLLPEGETMPSTAPTGNLPGGISRPFAGTAYRPADASPKVVINVQVSGNTYMSKADMDEQADILSERLARKLRLTSNQLLGV